MFHETILVYKLIENAQIPKAKSAKARQKLFSSKIVSLIHGSSSQTAKLKFSDLFPTLKNNLTRISSSKSHQRVSQSVARREVSEWTKERKVRRYKTHIKFIKANSINQNPTHQTSAKMMFTIHANEIIALC